MKTPTEIKQELEKGCGKYIHLGLNNSFKCVNRELCLTCKAKLTQFKEDCKRDLEFLTQYNLLENSIIDSIFLDKIIERINQLKEVGK